MKVFSRKLCSGTKAEALYSVLALNSVGYSMTSLYSLNLKLHFLLLAYSLLKVIFG